MFNIGGGEMMMLGLLALLVFGPQDLPRIIKKVMRTVRALRTAAADFQTEVHSALELENQKQDQAQRQRKPALEDASSSPLETEEPGEPEESTDYNVTSSGEPPESFAQASDTPSKEEPTEDSPLRGGQAEEMSASNEAGEALEAPKPDAVAPSDETEPESSDETEDPVEEEYDDGPGLPMAPPKKRVETA